MTTGNPTKGTSLQDSVGGAAGQVIECARCRETFEYPKSRGTIRKYCDKCRKPRANEMHRDWRYRARIKYLKGELRTIVRELVDEALIEAGVLKRANGANRGGQGPGWGTPGALGGLIKANRLR